MLYHVYGNLYVLLTVKHKTNWLTYFVSNLAYTILYPIYLGQEILSNKYLVANTKQLRTY